MSAADRARDALVRGLLAGGRIRGAAVEEAFRAVPRHHFLPGLSVAAAYADDAVAIQHVEGVATSSASQPSMVAIMLEQLDLRPGHRVLEIGAGTGWNAAMMARIVGPTGRITTVDIDPDLVESAARRLGGTGVEVVCADGALGHPAGAPYDRIVLTVGSDDVWPAWVEQLAPGGRLLLPLALCGVQLSAALDLAPDGRLHSDSLRSCGFIRLRGLGAPTAGDVALPGGLTLRRTGAAPPPDPATLAAALAEPGAPIPSPVPLRPADMWDGFALWLALTEPGAARLVGDGPELIDGATAALIDGPGLAAVVAAGTPGPEPRPVAVRPFGTGGQAAAARLLAALDGWVAAGSPVGADWQVTVAPGPTPPDVTAVSLQHCHVLVSLPRG